MARVTRASAAKAMGTTSTVVPGPLPTRPARGKKAPRKETKEDNSQPQVTHFTKVVSEKARSNRKRPFDAVKEEDVKNEVDDLPHNLGFIPDLLPKDSEDPEDASAVPTKKPRPSPKKKVPAKKSSEVTLGDDIPAAPKATSKPKATKKKRENYGIVFGETPFPDWPYPTPEQCEEVAQLLATVHGENKAPQTIPPPSLNVSGCGEVPSVLDAMIRTLLSANTTGNNSSTAFRGLVHKFGILQEGIGKGSVDWNKVRLADVGEIYDAIFHGGMADKKSKFIKECLQMVWEINQERKKSLLAAPESIPGAANETTTEQTAEIQKADDNVLSLDHLHRMTTAEAFDELIQFPGVAVKTASCVLLFCLQRPSFAVDTHVHRMCSWLGWVPPRGDPAGLAPGKKGTFKGATPNQAFAHLEVRIPDHLKYPLHQLFIKHGKTCPRCRGNTGVTYKDWDKGCVIDHLLTRTGARKNGDSPQKKLVEKVKPKRNKKKVEYASETESSELSDVGSDDESEGDDVDENTDGTSVGTGKGSLETSLEKEA